MRMTRENELMSRHARQMNITESSKQALFTRVLDDRYGNYRINCTYAHARDGDTDRLLLYVLLFAGVDPFCKLIVSTDFNQIG